jgi:two-component system sensor histidine kinase KdpD
LDCLPRKRLSYRNLTLEEFDLDTALKRRPELLLVDELAHTNAEGSRHPKRWQDVQELVKAGITVHSTLNIQHLEGLSDIVARITGVRVRETVPDRVIEEADELELIDLPPDELLARLEEGKVYVADLAARAREGFFKPGSLVALRELALRRTAERVDQQMVGYMREHAIEGPWQAGERVMVCIGGDGSGSTIVRAARRIADQLKAPWIVVHVERAVMDEAAEKSVSEAIALAERLGGRTERLVGSDLPGEILEYAKRNNITQIVVGRSRAGWLREFLRRSFVHELVRRSEGVAIHVVTPVQAPRRARWPKFPAIYGVAAAILFVTLALALAGAVPPLQMQPTLSMLFLAAVLVTALWQGLGSGLVAAILAFLAYNYFFTEPYFTLRISHWHDTIALLVFLIIAGTTGTLVGRVRDQAIAARSRIAALETLYTFSRRLGAAKVADELHHAVVLQVHRLSTLPAAILLPAGDQLSIRYAWPPIDHVDDVAMGAARWAFEHMESAGSGTGTLPSSSWQFRPLGTAKGPVGVLGIEIARQVLSPELLPTLDALLDQSAIAIERITFAEDIVRSTATIETERFRNALLSSVSHDLRTPLTSIIGSVTALRRQPSSYSAKAQDELLATIEEEAERLDRFVANLLDITRIEGGTLEVKREWLDIQEVIESALDRTSTTIGGVMIAKKFNPKLPLLNADFILLETVFINLFDNVAKHALGARNLEIAARVEDGMLLTTVSDDGDGIDPQQLPHIFDKYFRIRRKDYTVAGTGLGLAIAKGMVAVLGGRIDVQSPIDSHRGTRFTIRFPVEPQPELRT